MRDLLVLHRSAEWFCIRVMAQSKGAGKVEGLRARQERLQAALEACIGHENKGSRVSRCHIG